MTEEYKPLIIGGDYSRLLQCIEDLRALILPVVEAPEATGRESDCDITSGGQARRDPASRSLRRSDQPKGRVLDSPWQSVRPRKPSSSSRRRRGWRFTSSV